MKRIFIIPFAVWACVFNVNAQLVVDSLGRVGISTDKPTESLTIHRIGNDDSVMKLYQGSANFGLKVFASQHSTFTGSMTGIDVRGYPQKDNGYVGVNSLVGPLAGGNIPFTSVGISGGGLGLTVQHWCIRKGDKV